MGLNGLFVFLRNVGLFCSLAVTSFCALGGFSVWTPVGTDASLDNNGTRALCDRRWMHFLSFLLFGECYGSCCETAVYSLRS